MTIHWKAAVVSCGTACFSILSSLENLFILDLVLSGVKEITYSTKREGKIVSSLITNNIL